MPRLTWPNGARCAVCLTFDNLGEAFDRRVYGHAAGLASEGEYAVKAGVPRLLDLFDRQGVKVTFFFEGWNGEHNAATIQEVIRRGHEVAAHGWMHEQWNELSAESERDLLTRATAALERAAGRRPAGWRSPSGLMTERTIPLLKELGYRYDSSYMDDDLPYPMAGAGQGLIQLPWSWELDDAVYYAHGRGNIVPPEVVESHWRADFDACYEEIGYWMLVCHSRFSGRPARARALERLIEHIKGHDGVWFARCDELAEWVRGRPAGGS